MAYFAELDESNVVLRVVAIANEDCTDANGAEQEQLGVARCLELFQTGVWKQTSYNTYGGVHLTGGAPFRKNFAAIGYIYDTVKDAFIPLTPEGEGWVLNEEKCIWENPTLIAAQAQIQTGVTRV